MKIHTELAKGLFLIEKKTIADERGFFERIFCPEELKELWGTRKVEQVNRSLSKEVGTFRGFHYQRPPFAEMKFIQCIQGRVVDFAIDLRADSKTFLQVFSFELSAKNNLCALIPEYFAHGFQTLEENTELIYFHSAPYKKEYEKGLNYLDLKLNIKLPLPALNVSSRDQCFEFIDENFEGLKI